MSLFIMLIIGILVGFLWGFMYAMAKILVVEEDMTQDEMLAKHAKLIKSGGTVESPEQKKNNLIWAPILIILLIAAYFLVWGFDYFGGY